jgi:hypothetical protein
LVLAKLEPEGSKRGEKLFGARMRLLEWLIEWLNDERRSLCWVPACPAVQRQRHITLRFNVGALNVGG